MNEGEQKEGFQGEECYTDRSIADGFHLVWNPAQVVIQHTTAKGTNLEMVQRPHLGLACYMNGEIQSAEVDEAVYHEALVHPVMVHSSTPPRRVLILGGGEGATAREVLKWSSVERIDMYEWDEEVTTLFRTRFPQWGKGAWDDPRLVLHHEDVFTVFRGGNYPPVPYDVIIVDLFEPSETMWTLFTVLALNWLAEGGALTMYAGIRNPRRDIHPAEEWLAEERVHTYDDLYGMDIQYILGHRDVYSYKVFLPSFLGEGMFLMICPSSFVPSFVPTVIATGITPDIWKAYATWNRYPLCGTNGVVQGV